MKLFKYIIIVAITMMVVGCGNTSSKTLGQNEEVSEIQCVAIDLGLPSGTLWAESNLGATSCEEPGCFFYWGDIEPFQPGLRYKYVNDAYYDERGGGGVQYLKYVTK